VEKQSSLQVATNIFHYRVYLVYYKGAVIGSVFFRMFYRMRTTGEEEQDKLVPWI